MWCRLSRPLKLHRTGINGNPCAATVALILECVCQRGAQADRVCRDHHCGAARPHGGDLQVAQLPAYLLASVTVTAPLALNGSGACLLTVCPRRR